MAENMREEMKLKIWFAALTMFLTPAICQGQETTLKSPDRRIIVEFSLNHSTPLAENGTGRLEYAVTFKGVPIVDKSVLGLALDDKEPLGSHVKIADTKPSSGTDDYRCYLRRRAMCMTASTR